MTTTVLLQKLLTIEQAIGTADNGTLRQLVYEAEDCLLRIQKERAQEFYRDYWSGSKPRLNLASQIERSR